MGLGRAHREGDGLRLRRGGRRAAQQGRADEARVGLRKAAPEVAHERAAAAARLRRGVEALAVQLEP